MRVVRLYTDQSLAPEITLKLDDAARYYATTVLRVNQYSNLALFNGDGFDYPCEVLECSKSSLQVKILNKSLLNSESKLNIRLYLGISKSAHMNYAIQKSVEAGVTSICPIMMERSIGKKNNKSLTNKHRHWQRIIISACEQSGRAVIPNLNSITDLTAIEPLLEKEHGLLFDTSANQIINDLKLNHPTSIKFVIGPEGGLSKIELESLQQKGFQTVKLGPRTLRTETAAVGAIFIAQLLWGDLNK